MKWLRKQGSGNSLVIARPLLPKKPAARPRRLSLRNDPLVRARAEAVRSAAYEDLVWLALALSAAALLILSLWIG
jgi:hypothetical protein